MTVQPQSAPATSDPAFPLQNDRPVAPSAQKLPEKPGRPPAVSEPAGGMQTTQHPAAAEASVVLPTTVVQLLVPVDQPLPAARRLIVLVPDEDTDKAELARRIWTLASPRGLAVLFLGFSSSPDTEYRARRRLAALAAMTRDDRVAVETRLEFASDWLQVVKSHHRPGDLVICHAEQSVGRWGMRRPLSQSLTSALNAPVLALSGFYPEMPTPSSGFVTWLVSWGIPLAIVAGFFWLQVYLDQALQGGVKLVLLCFSIVVEFSLLALLNRPGAT